MKPLILIIFFTLPLLLACNGKKTRGPEKGPIKTDTLQQAMQAGISCHSSIPSRFAKIDTTKTNEPGIQNPGKAR